MNHHNVEQEEHEAVVELVKESGDMVTLNVQSIKQELIMKLNGAKMSETWCKNVGKFPWCK